MRSKSSAGAPISWCAMYVIAPISSLRLTSAVMRLSWPIASTRAIHSRRSRGAAAPAAAVSGARAGVGPGSPSGFPGSGLGGDLRGVETVDLVDQVVGDEVLSADLLLDDVPLEEEVGVALIVGL